MIKEVTLDDLLLKGESLLQREDAETAYETFREVSLGEETTPRQRCTAYQQMGVCARMMGKLKMAQKHLEDARDLSMEYGLDALGGAVLRDLAAVHEWLYLGFRQGFRGYEQEQANKHLEQARRYYKKSEELLSSALAYEVCTTQVYATFLEWQATEQIKNHTHRKQEELKLSQLLRLYYGDLVFFAAIRPSVEQQPKVCQINALIRVLRTLPLATRLKFKEDVLRLTAKDSPSPGTRKRALVALLTGNLVYGRVELRKAQRSR